MIVLDDDATDEREQFGSVEDRGLVENSPWDALGATAAYSCLSRLEDSVAGALAKSAGLVMMRCGNGPHPRLLSEGEGRNAAFSMLRWEQRSPRRCLGEDRRGEFGSLRESLAKTRGV
ncbi:MAG: hypothetical protein DME40_07175 [Verrucomicrobia bacterium]|nr:MAG: hypothetical protein DME37_07355 [Verrucomicrobiota bacterium]PYK91146.1 MAG: hypothetical protein DME40_07175 [Verrucomicrobiota bacterium]PYL78685.1 MAG: hypothetical protein DMF27_03365 [Verrucomicrobiota bacterium]PYM07764.1 MAG: hypothetical protein DMF15_09885 [Verrucomicrobiota bacterium]